MTEIQKIGVKIFASAPVGLSLEPFLSIFGRWRTDTSHPARWVDLADYAHIPGGPGIVLVGHMCNFSFDLGSPAPGILYVSKKGLSGATEDRLATVFGTCFGMARLLLAEQEFPAGVHLRSGSLEVIFNDRLETPHTDATDRLLRPAVTGVLDRWLGQGAYHLAPERDSGRRYGFFIEAATPAPLDTLMARLQD